MDRLIAPNSVPLAGADLAPSSGTPQYATDGVPGTTAPTIFPAYAWNMVQDEIMAVINAAGLTPDKTNWGQLLTAIETLISSGGLAPYDQAGGANVIGPSQIVFFFLPARPCTIPINFAGSLGKALTPAAGTPAFTIKKNTTTIGSMNFASGAGVPTFSVAAATSLNGTGDYVLITGPATPDTALAQFQMTVKVNA